MLDRLSSLLARQKVPLLNVRAAQSWWKPINETDPASQLQQVHDVIADFFAADPALSHEVLQSLLWLDNAVQPAFESICFQYVSNPRMPKEIEQKLWRLICGFSQKLVDVYGRYVQASGRENSNNAFNAEMPQVLARSLRYIAIQAKWHYFRFEKAPAKLWIAAHQYYRLAEIEGFDCDPFMLYPGVSEQVTSCADEYIQMLMLATVSSNNLTVMQMNNVDLWLDRWSKLLQLSRQYQDDRHHYRVCLQGSNGPQKIGTPDKDEPYRYWGIGELVSCVQETLARLEAGATPKSLALGENNSSAGVVELLKHLELFWTMSMRNNQIQRTERLKVNKAANVIHGLEMLCSHVRVDNDRYRKENGAGSNQFKVDVDEVMDMRLYGFVSSRTRAKIGQSPYTVHVKQHDWQTWIIDNESAGGLGAVLNYSTNEWVRPGLVIGVRLSDKENWQIGVLRRLNRMNEDEVYAGVQILTTAPVAVTMRSDDLDRIENITVSESDFHGGIDLPNVRMALYLPHKVDGNNVNTLIMRAADYSHNRVYQVQAHDKVFSVRLGSVLEKGIDWTWVAVNVLRQDN